MGIFEAVWKRPGMYYGQPYTFDKYIGFINGLLVANFGKYNYKTWTEFVCRQTNMPASHTWEACIDRNVDNEDEFIAKLFELEHEFLFKDRKCIS